MFSALLNATSELSKKRRVLLLELFLQLKNDQKSNIRSLSFIFIPLGTSFSISALSSDEVPHIH
jgi:hypothetical protein